MRPRRVARAPAARGATRARNSAAPLRSNRRDSARRATGQERDRGIAGHGPLGAARRKQRLRRRAHRREQGAAYRAAAQSRGEREEPSARFDASALEPQRHAVARDLRAHAALALGVALARARAAEAQDLPPDIGCIAFKPDFRMHVGQRAVEDDRLLRQPFDARAALHVERDVHARPRSARTVPFARARRRQQRVRALIEPNLDVELVAARDARRGMHDDRVADGIAFGIQRLLNDERSVVAALREHRALAATLVFERESGTPAAKVYGIGDAHAAIILRGGLSRRRAPCPRRAPRAMISPRSMTRYWSASERAKS